ncbi:MAG: SRPBCC domain-containing protein [Armatimonadota bacterium]
MTKQVGKAEMLIRHPVREVFNAFVDPDTITKFWLESTTGPLSKGAQVEWRFMVPGATEAVTVTAFEVDRHIAFDWSDGISVDMKFADDGDSVTRLAVEVSGFRENAVDEVVGATEGFSIVVCDLKTLLETGRSANLVRDKAELIARS